jgi:hypothetical protein
VEKSTDAIVAAIRRLDPDGGWDHKIIGGWPDMATYRALVADTAISSAIAAINEDILQCGSHLIQQQIRQ